MSMQYFEPLHNPAPGYIRKEDEYERHVVDIGNLGMQLHNYLTLLFKDRGSAADVLRYVYIESFAQMVLAMDYS